MKEGKIVGIGGIFFKCKDPNSTKKWYVQHMGMEADQWGASFISRKYNDPKQTAYLQWSPFVEDTEYFGDSGQEFMINYRVKHLEQLKEKLESDGVKFVDEISSYDYGKFVHCIDGDARMIELWEPIDSSFDNLYKDKKLNME